MPVRVPGELPLYSKELYLAIFGLACLEFCHLSAQTKSMEYNTVGVAQVIFFICIPLSYFLDWAVLHEPMGAMELSGAALICGINILITTLRLKGKID